MKRNGDGAKGTAPCGHPGTYVTTSMVLCDLEDCNGSSLSAWYDKVQRATLHNCRHPIKVTFSGTTSCRACGKVFRK